MGTDPINADIIGNYAYFLINIRKNNDKAEEYFLKALQVDPDHANNNGNYAHMIILCRMDFKSASKYIEKAFDTGGGDDLISELWFYRFAHYPEHREQAEEELNKLIKKAAKSIAWNFLGHVEIAEKNGHPKLEKLKEFAKALGEE